MQAEPKLPSRAHRRLGGVIFAVGMMMLFAVFALAALSFAQVPQALATTHTSASPGLGARLAAAAARAGFLLVMAYVSSLLAAKGLDLYQAGQGRRGD